MTTAPAPTRAGARLRPAVPPFARLSFFRVFRSEVVKFTTLRSTWWSLAITVVLSVGIALLIATASTSLGEGPNGAPVVVPPVTVITAPMQFTMLVAGIFGAMAITGEYSTGMIRSTLGAEPRRGRVLLAKAAAVAAFLIVTVVVSTLLAVVVTAPILGDGGFDWSDSDTSTVPLAFGVLGMVAVGLMGLGWGFIIRNGAGAIATTVGLLFVAPIILSLFTLGGEAWQWVVDLGQHLPAGAAATLVSPDPADLTASVISLVAWPIATLTIGWVLLRTRDA